jgi:hypothetical protein
MDVKEIVKKYLEENGYDGLWLPGFYCGCFLSDIMPCTQPEMICEAGYKVPCDDERDRDSGEICIGKKKDI